MREGQLIFERRHHLTRNLGIWPFVNGWEANFYVVCDREYAGHSLRRLFGFVFIYVAGHKPSQGDNTIFYGDGYVGRLEIGIPFEFSLHVSFDFTIGFHGLTPQLLAPRVAGSKLYIQWIRGQGRSLWSDGDRLTRQVLGFHSADVIEFR